MITPHVGDHIYNHARAEVGQMPHGYVIMIPPRKWDERECIVKYFKPLPIFSQVDPEFGLPGDDVDSIMFDEFDQYKVSSECGEFTDPVTESWRRYHARAEGRVDNGTSKCVGVTGNWFDVYPSLPTPKRR